MKHTFATGFLCCILATAGCGPQSKNPPTYPVTGKVIFQDAPLADVNVTFQPEKGRQAMGTTDAEGKFTLSTFAQGDGAIPGEHRVAVSPNIVNEPMPGTPEYVAAQKQRPTFPPKFRDAQASGLTATVTQEGENNFTFDLSSP